jgi:hypothetical protein
LIGQVEFHTDHIQPGVDGAHLGYFPVGGNRRSKHDKHDKHGKDIGLSLSLSQSNDRKKKVDGWEGIRKLSLPIFHARPLFRAPSFSMLSESFVASTLLSAKSSAATLRDVGICLQEFQPSPQIRSTFKKSSTHPNGLAVSPTHIFAAQADKAVIHVYSREKGNQEALVPFPERIRSIAVAGAKYGDVLILGTEGGRLIVWEV